MTAALSGTGQGTSVTLTPATPLTFAVQQIGTVSTAQVATLTNTGGASVSITSISISGVNAADFVQTNTCGVLPATLAAGATGTCAISVTFKPTLVGTETATLTVVDAAGTQTVTLSGTGAAASVKLNPAAPMGIAFPVQQLGTTSAAQVATLTNTGAGPVTVTGITITGLNATDFAQTSNCPVSPLTLAAGAICTVNVTFTPTVAVPESATLNVATSAGAKAASLSGNAQPPLATLTPTTPLAFTAQTGVASTAQVATLTNTGVGPLTVSSITIAGTNATEFAQTNTCGVLPATLAAGGTCTMSVTFKPATAGSKTATLTVVDAAGTQTVTLNGTGAAPTATLTPHADHVCDSGDRRGRHCTGGDADQYRGRTTLGQQHHDRWY